MKLHLIYSPNRRDSSAEVRVHKAGLPEASQSKVGHPGYVTLAEVIKAEVEESRS